MQANPEKPNRQRWERPPQWGTTAIAPSLPRRELRGRLRHIWSRPYLLTSSSIFVSLPAFVSPLSSLSPQSSSVKHPLSSVDHLSFLVRLLRGYQHRDGYGKGGLP